MFRCQNQDRTKITWNPTCNQNIFALKISDIRILISDIRHWITWNPTCNYKTITHQPML